MYHEGLVETVSPKPRLEHVTPVMELVDVLRTRGVPGWFRIGAHLLGLSTQAQETLVRQRREAASRTRGDGRLHNAARIYHDPEGPVVFIQATFSSDVDSAATFLRSYTRAKDHQARAYMTMGVLFEAAGSLTATSYLNAQTGNDAELDALVEALRLQPIESSARTMPPPSARRATRRLRGPGRGGRRR